MFDQEESSDKKNSKNILRRAYDKIANLTKQLLQHQKYPRQDLIQANKIQPHSDPDTRQLLDELDFAYRKLKEYETAISLMSRSIQSYKSKYPAELDEVAKREGQEAKVGELGDDLVEVMEELEESYVKIDKLQKELVAVKNESAIEAQLNIAILKIKELESIHTANLEEEEKDSKSVQGVANQGLLAKAYSKIKSLTKKLISSQKYPREDELKAHKVKPSQDEDKNQLLDELDFAYRKLKEYETAISLMSRSIQSYKSKYPAELDEVAKREGQEAKVGELGDDFGEILEDLEESYE